MLGSLIAGGTFCPVDVTTPEARNATICTDFAPHVVLYENTPPSFLSALPVTTPTADMLKPPTTRLANPATDHSDVAYVIFTSGSTGRPKGVRISRRSFSHFLDACRPYFHLSLGEKWGQWSSLAHDLGVMDVFMTLTQGGTLVPLTAAERLRPAMAIRNRRISVWQSVPTAIDFMMRGHHLTNHYLTSLRVMSFCGEPLRRDHLRALFTACPDLHVFNTYGTTETTGFNTLNHLTAENFMDSCELESAAIGQDVPGWTVHLRGEHGNAGGEIVVTSDFLSAGYCHDEERTRSAFGEIYDADSTIQRCYYTGDLGVRRGGRLYCSGRLDRQVKIRGERIELGEIDSRLRQMGFSNAYTIYEGDHLHAFVESTDSLDTEQIRTYLRKSLSIHAIPHTIRALPSFPRNQGGKIDRDALLQII